MKIAHLHTAWAAGLFEGEGCISIIKAKKSTHSSRVMLTLAMTDLDTVLKFFVVAGGGRLYLRKAVPPRQAVWMWRLQETRDACELLRRMLPWLSHRRATKAREAIAIDDEKWRTCYCGKHFYAKYQNKRYCSHDCANVRRTTQFKVVA